jgi:cellulose biosynthesis protein BcsQ
VKVIASYNIKGGVGKTSAAVNLSYLAAREGASTLVWDLDPQGAASFYFRIKPKIQMGSRGLLRRKRALEKVIKGTDYTNLDLIPADFSYRNMDLILEGFRRPRNRIRKLLKPMAREYDYVFIDCAPSISLVSENVFTAADVLLVPTIPTTLSLRTLDQLVTFIAAKGYGNFDMVPFFSMVDRRKNIHRLITSHRPMGLGKFLENVIPYASVVERMGTERTPLEVFARSSPAAAAFRSVWAELKTRI